MAARATRSASRKARVAEAVATGPLGALSHDELGVIFDGLADPLRPVIAVALSSTCLGLRTPLRVAVAVLKERHVRAEALCRKVGYVAYCDNGVVLEDKVEMNCELLRGATEIDLLRVNVTSDDMATLGMLLGGGSLPRLRCLYPKVGDLHMQALCEGIGRGAAPDLAIFGIAAHQLGPVGAETLAAALGRGAMPNLKGLYLTGSPFGNQGVIALAGPVRKLPLLEQLYLGSCQIGDEGMASLFADLKKGEFKALVSLDLDSNEFTDEGIASLDEALKRRAFIQALADARVRR